MKQKAITLIEILVSMIILSVFLAGLSGLFTAATNQLTRAQYKQEALNFAREKLEQLQALDFDDSGLQAAEYNDTVSEYAWPRIWVIADEDFDENGIIDAKIINVEVQWHEP